MFLKFKGNCSLGCFLTLKFVKSNFPGTLRWAAWKITNIMYGRVVMGRELRCHLPKLRVKTREIQLFLMMPACQLPLWNFMALSFSGEYYSCFRTKTRYLVNLWVERFLFFKTLCCNLLYFFNYSFLVLILSSVK